MEQQVIALGFFDGVHLGHQALLAACRNLAQNLGAVPVALTFTSHPDQLVLGQSPELINTPEDRVRLLYSYGMERVIQLPFDNSMQSMEWEAFLRLLMEKHHAVGLVCGHDFRFGWKGEGTASLLEGFCREHGLGCQVVPEQRKDGMVISSTLIRSKIASGQMEEAVALLGHRHILTGCVVTGRKLGHKLGFPTANIQLPAGVCYPKFGVYACRVGICGVSRMAVTNVGSRPTVEGHQVRTESWILDFSGDLYGREITLEFCSFLRPEQRFDSLEQLQQAVGLDAVHAREYFGT